MLKFQDEDETMVAEQVRVNPQELIEALRAVEARKEAEARAQEETLSIGQAIQALGLTYTPEEVLEAVQAHRVRQEQTRSPLSVYPRKRTTAGRMILPMAFLSATVVTFVLWTSGLFKPVRAIETVDSPPAAASAPVIFETKPLSEILVGGTFHSDTGTLVRLANGTAGPETVVEVNGEHNDLWTAIRAPGGIEVQGYMTTADALKFVNGQQATLYRNTEMFSASTSFTSVGVPLSRLKNITSPPGEPNDITIEPVPQKAQ